MNIPLIISIIIMIIGIVLIIKSSYSLKHIHQVNHAVDEANKSLLEKIEDILNDLSSANGKELNEVLNDSLTKTNAFVNKKNEIVNGLKKYIKFADNYNLYIEDMNILFDIHQNIINTRNEEFLNKIVFPLNEIETN